jgi:hypothetical protein
VDYGSGRSLGTRFRLQRWDLFATVFPDVHDMDVIDLGGRIDMWESAPRLPRSVVILNLETSGRLTTERIVFVQGDACDPPPEVRSRRFDLVFSNSLIEHVGGHARRLQLAEKVRQLGDRHWVQTPYRYFPIEPHWLFPGFQFLPVRARAAIARHWKLSGVGMPGRRSSVRNVLDVELISRTELRYYFPDSELLVERLAGLPKSLIAVKRE